MSGPGQRAPLVPWAVALEWWGDGVGLTDFLLACGWDANSGVHDETWKPALEPIFWETVKAASTGGVSR